MKQLFLVISCFIAYVLQAQDTIRFRNGEIKSVKVNEVGLNEIKFNRFDLQDGPSYVVDKNDILLIKYGNGQVDSFKVSKQTAPIVLMEPVKKAGPAYNNIIYDRGNLFRSKKRISGREFADMINNHPDTSRRTQIHGLMKEVGSYKGKQYMFGFLGLGAALTTFVICSVGGDVGLGIGAILGTGVFVTSQVYSKINKNKRLKKLRAAVDLYNK